MFAIKTKLHSVLLSICNHAVVFNGNFLIARDCVLYFFWNRYVLLLLLILLELLFLCEALDRHHQAAKSRIQHLVPTGLQHEARDKLLQSRASRQCYEICTYQGRESVLRGLVWKVIHSCGDFALFLNFSWIILFKSDIRDTIRFIQTC